MPTTTVFLSYLTNTARRRGCGRPQGVPVRHNSESPAGTLAGSRDDVDSSPTRRGGRTWGSGLGLWRAGSAEDSGASAARGSAVTASWGKGPSAGPPGLRARA